MTRAGGGVFQTHTVVRFSIFFFCLKDAEKWWWTVVSFSQFFDVGPKWVFQSFLWLDRKNSPIFTFDRIVKNLEKWTFYRKNEFLKIFFSCFGAKMVIFFEMNKKALIYVLIAFYSCIKRKNRTIFGFCTFFGLKIQKKSKVVRFKIFFAWKITKNNKNNRPYFLFLLVFLPWNCQNLKFCGSAIYIYMVRF